MDQTIILKHLSEDEIKNQNIYNWPIWEKEISEFPWTYEAAESCLILEGEVTVTPDSGAPVEIKAGDFVVFPAGMTCRWNIHKAIRKHYNFS